jgi:phenylacetate-CoA ligase
MSRLDARARRLAYIDLQRGAHIPVGAVARELTREKTLPAAAITRRRLARALGHAVLHVPFYRDVLARTDDDPYTTLSRAPLLTRGMLRSQFYDLLSDDLDKRHWRHQNGRESTGSPIRFVQDNAHLAAEIVTLERFHEALGRRTGEPVEFFWGSEHDVIDATTGVRKRMLNWLAGERWTHVIRPTDAEAAALFESVRRRRPKLIVGYPQPLYELARVAERSGAKPPRPIAIVTTAGTLYGFMRVTIERVFGCPVFDEYSSRELGPIAIECTVHQGMHVAPWAAYVEIMDESGYLLPPGVEGQIVVTCLTNAAMPLIRYAIGDQGALMPSGRCKCGRAGQRLAHVSGRLVDALRARDGSLVDSAFFAHLLYNRAWVEQFQVVQKDHGRLLFRIVPAAGAEMPPAELAEIADAARAALGLGSSVEFDRARKIDAEGSGKYRYTVSELSAT